MTWSPRIVLIGTLTFVVPAQRTDPPDPVVWVENTSSVAREEIVRVPFPWPRGALVAPDLVAVDGEAVPAVTLVRWPDGSSALTQLHVPIALAAKERRRLVVSADAVAVAAPAESWPLGSLASLHTELEDPWGKVYVARLAASEVIAPSSPLVRVRRFVAHHESDETPFLPVVAYLTEFHGERRAELTLVLDNRAHVDGPEFGPVRFHRFSLVATDPALRFRPRFREENALAPALPLASGGFRQDLLGPSHEMYLGDRTAKAFRIDLFRDDEESSESERERVRVAVDEPLVAWPDVSWTRHTGAFGAHGGPAPAGWNTSSTMWMTWRQGARFGPFTGHGDPEDVAAQGSPRNGPSALHNVLRWRSVALLQAAETIALQQALRPTAGFEVRRPRDMAAFREGLSLRAQERPHAFTALDYEHFSVDLLYDYYWLTGDPFARAELARAGVGLRRLLAGLPFMTSRGEGWCMQGGVLIARATDDDALLGDLAGRVREQVVPRIGGPPGSVAIPQPPHPEAFGKDDEFDAPWQMAALVQGLHALHAATDDQVFADVGVRVARVIAGPGWVEDEGPKYLVSARDRRRYIMPVGYGPMEGTAPMHLGALVLAREMTENVDFRLLFERRAGEIARAHHAPENHQLLSDPWFQLYLDRRRERRPR